VGFFDTCTIVHITTLLQLELSSTKPYISDDPSSCANLAEHRKVPVVGQALISVPSNAPRPTACGQIQSPFLLDVYHTGLSLSKTASPRALKQLRRQANCQDI